MPKCPEIAFSLIGGSHQFLHIVPVLAALAGRKDVRTVAYVADHKDAKALSDLLQRLGAQPVDTVVMTLPRWIERWVRAAKSARLLWWARPLRSATAIVAAERTSTVLKLLPGHSPPMFHIPHGAGDRRKGYDPRIRRFDHLIVAGDKDHDRMIAEGLVSPDRCSVAGYIKLSALLRAGATAPRLFHNDRPILLYNAHFDARLSSWASSARSLIDAVREDGRYNLIVAPHVRMFEHADDHMRQSWQALEESDRIIVDLGSSRSIDMTYTMAADVYIGDVSSQVYEFAAQPRPCLFINSHGADWPDSPDYRMWHFGPVVEPTADLICAIDNAIAQFPAFRAAQEVSVRAAFGDYQSDAAARAADIIVDVVNRTASAR